MNTTVLILAAGEGIRFKKDKQLLPIGDELVIQRIIRQCNQRGATPYVVTHSDRIDQFVQRIGGAHLFLPARHRWLVDTWLSTRELWEQRTIVLLGDVIYSKALMDRIFNVPRYKICCVFGNKWEMYATVFLDLVQGSARVETALKTAAEFSERNDGPGKMRTFYQAYCGLELGGTAIEEWWRVLSCVSPDEDYTRDLDTPEEYRKAVKTLVKRGVLDDLP